jgi:nitrogen-specific signal transduction histidine kinase
VPFDRVGKFVRQLSHDVRNNLGAMDLQAAFIAELVDDPEVVAELKKLREMVTGATRMLQGVSVKFVVQQGSPITVAAHIIMEDFQQRFSKTAPEEAALVDWDVALGTEEITVDIEQFFTALSEIFRNAFYFRGRTENRCVARVSVKDERMVLELQQPANETSSDPTSWGADPLVSTRRGGYGLGLYHARQILAAHGASLEFAAGSGGVMSTLIALPLATAAAV